MRNIFRTCNAFILIVTPSITFATPVCNSPDLNITQTVSGKTACVGTPGNWESQEFHGGDSGVLNNLIDYKLGPGHSIDPQGPVGTWTYNQSSATITYTYGGNSYETIYCGVQTSPQTEPPTFTSTYFTNDSGRSQVVSIQNTQNGCQ